MITVEEIFLFPSQTAEGSKVLSTPKCTHDPEVASFIKVRNGLNCRIPGPVIFISLNKPIAAIVIYLVLQ